MGHLIDGTSLPVTILLVTCYTRRVRINYVIQDGVEKVHYEIHGALISYVREVPDQYT